MKQRADYVAFVLFMVIVAASAHVCAQTVTVSTVAQLETAVENANSGNVDTILLTNGTYMLSDMLAIWAVNLTVRSLSGNRDTVIIRGQGMAGSVTHVFNVGGSGFHVYDMTLRDVANHAIQLQLDVDDVHIENIHILDTGEQMIKIPFLDGDPRRCDNGVITRCLMEYSAGIGPQYYIGGVDGHFTRNWVISDNVFIGIRSPDENTAEHAIHFWSNAENTIVERNLIVNCDRGIGFGLGDRGHIGGIIRNNMIFHNTTEGVADVGIGIENSPGTIVCNNTIIFQNSYPNAIEYRFPGTTNVTIANNLTNRAILLRDGASGTETHNIETAEEAWFVSPAQGNLHLKQGFSNIVDQGTSIAELVDDFDHEPRPNGPGIDIGADEYTLVTPALSLPMMLIIMLILTNLILKKHRHHPDLMTRRARSSVTDEHTTHNEPL